MFKVAVAATAIALLAACDAQSPVNNSAVANSAVTNAADAADTVAVDADTAKRLFHERHEGMEAIGKATKAAGETLKSPSPEMAVIRESAAKIAELAEKSGDWFPAGTGAEVLPKTRAKAEIWQKPQDFADKDDDFRKAAHAFDAAAKSGDLNAVKSSFETLGKSCKACHDDYRAEKHDK